MRAIIPFSIRSHSGTNKINCLYKEGNIYISDNHLFAAWAWGQEIPLGMPYSIFHIDRHYDLLQSRINEWVGAAPKIDTNTKIFDYISCESYSSDLGNTRIFRWDNYFPIFIKQREENLQNALFMTHEIGDKPWFEHRIILPTESPENIPYWLKGSSKYIFNLDVDFFFLSDSDSTIRMYSDDYIKMLAKHWREAHDNDLLYCTTIAISPEMCGGWQPAIQALSVFCEAAHIPLPTF